MLQFNIHRILSVHVTEPEFFDRDDESPAFWSRDLIVKYIDPDGRECTWRQGLFAPTREALLVYQPGVVEEEDEGGAVEAVAG